MSEQLYGYTINYVEKGWTIDHGNYNNLVGAIAAFVGDFLEVFEQAVNFFGDPGLYNYYQTYSNIANQFMKNVEEGRYRAEYMAPVYTYHYQDLAGILQASASGFHNIFNYLETAGISIPEDVTAALGEAIDTLDKYPKLITGMVVEPEHHNDVLKVAKLLHEVLMWLKLLLVGTAVLTILSEPITGVTFQIDEYVNTTPFQQTLPKRSYIIIMPRVVIVDDGAYRFIKWKDGPTSRIRTIYLVQDTTLTAQYEWLEPFEPLGIAGVTYQPPEG